MNRITALKTAVFGADENSMAYKIGEKLGKAVHAVTHTSIADAATKTKEAFGDGKSGIQGSLTKLYNSSPADMIEGIKNIPTKITDKLTLSVASKALGKPITQEQFDLLKQLMSTGEAPANS